MSPHSHLQLSSHADPTKVERSRLSVEVLV
jgi:hypothetical protein